MIFVKSYLIFAMETSAKTAATNYDIIDKSIPYSIILFKHSTGSDLIIHV